jgi:hypothetical protein
MREGRSDSSVRLGYIKIPREFLSCFCVQALRRAMLSMIDGLVTIKIEEISWTRAAL